MQLYSSMNAYLFQQLFCEKGDFYVIDKWTGRLIGNMHIYNITSAELAAKLGLHPKYVSAILNGHRSPTGAKQRFEKAVAEIIDERKSWSA